MEPRALPNDELDGEDQEGVKTGDSALNEAPSFSLYRRPAPLMVDNDI